MPVIYCSWEVRGGSETLQGGLSAQGLAQGRRSVSAGFYYYYHCTLAVEEQTQVRAHLMEPSL